jgi:hypothetical protein
MLQDVVSRRIKTSYRKETGGSSYMPRRFTPLTRVRFFLDRRKTYLKRIDGLPSHAQLAMITAMARLEWFALAAEQGNDLRSTREGRENRRLLLKVITDFDQSLKPKATPAPRSEGRKPKPGPSQLSLEEHLELLNRQGGVR